MIDQPQRVSSNCRFCGYLCGLIATVSDGLVTAVEPDPNRYPYDIRIQNGCRRWRSILEFLDHSERVNYPLKRVGDRGSGQWQQITWDEALDEIADRLSDLQQKFGPETLATSIGGPHATYWPLHRFMNLFGSPNNMGIGQICWNPGVWVNTLTCGWPVENELDPESTKCAILWGTNPAESDNSLFWRTIQQYSRDGKPLIVVDPRRTRTAVQASLWLPIQPGTDIYLALGLLNILISRKLFDQSFVNTWCKGFDQLQEHVLQFPLSKVVEVTGVQVELIIKAAELYAAYPPAALITGRGIDQLGRNTVPTHRVLAILRALTGNLDVRGASHLGEMPDFIPEVKLELSDLLSETQKQKQLNEGKLSLQSYSGYQKIMEATKQHGRRLPMRYLTSAHPNLVWRAMLNSDPYPLRSMIVMGSDPLLTQADSHLIYQALKSLDLLVVLEYFKTPTAMLADFILPSAGGLERPLFQTHAGIANIAYGGEQAVEPYYERRPDYYFWRELGMRMGQEEYWPWTTFNKSLEETLAPAKVSWEQFCEKGLYYNPSPYLKHEIVDPRSGKKSGFSTPSGKVELVSELLASLGDDLLPTPRSNDLKNADYPLTLITGARRQPFYASSYRQITSLRQVHQTPLVELSVKTASSIGLAEGDLALIQTQSGQGQFQVKLAEICEGTASVEYGWWFPETSVEEPNLGGLWISNANSLTNADIENSDSLIGTWVYNGIPCRISPLLMGNNQKELEILNER